MTFARCADEACRKPVRLSERLPDGRRGRRTRVSERFTTCEVDAAASSPLQRREVHGYSRHVTEPSGVEPITSPREANQSRLILADICRALEQVETPEAREVLLDLKVMHQAALDGWEIASRTDSG